MLQILGVLISLSLPLAAQSWDTQTRQVAMRAAQSIRQAKVSRLKNLAEQAQAQAASLAAQYRKDPIAVRLKLDPWGYGLPVNTVFEYMAEPETSSSGFGIQTGPHIGTDGSIHPTGPGAGFATRRSSGYLTEAVNDIAALVSDPNSKDSAGDVMLDIRDARDILRKHLDKLKGYSPKNSAEAAWKAQAIPSWTDLMAKIDEAYALADSLR